MKKPITIWTIVLSLFVIAGFNSASAQERRSVRVSPTQEKAQLKEQSATQERQGTLAPSAVASPDEKRVAPSKSEEEKLNYLKQNHPDQYLDYLRINDPAAFQKIKEANSQEAPAKKLNPQEKEELYLENRAEYERIYNSAPQQKSVIPYEEFITMPKEKRDIISSQPDKYEIRGGSAK